jgi:VIT1/CCC1 family predicted Fe2+/Mn2+ transporter
MQSLDTETRNTILAAQRNEITEHYIYAKLARAVEDEHNKAVLTQISQEEREHYRFWKGYTGEEVQPDRVKIWRFYLLARLFGLTFGIKLMEQSEQSAEAVYEQIAKHIPLAKEIVHDEGRHEQQLVALIDEERLRYVGSMVLGLNDALVELTGALAGFTFALQSTRLIGVTGLITGIAASLSMGTSEYLSTKSEDSSKHPAKAAVYTGVAYVITVLLLVTPYLVLSNVYVCLGLAIVNGIIVILMFTFYVSVAQDIAFKTRFLEMVVISLGVAGLSFVIGFVVRVFLQVEV